MLTMNHTAVYYLKNLRHFCEDEKTFSLMAAARRYVSNTIPLLLLPDAIRMYGPRQQFHFTEHPITKEVSTVKFSSSPDTLKGIKDAFQADLKPDIPKCVIDEMSHPEVFVSVNPDWAKTAYVTHLYQDCAWDKWIREMVDVSDRLNDKFTYVKSGKTVDGATFRNELAGLDNVFFQKVAKKIRREFRLIVDKAWFARRVYASLLEEYDEELAENTWKYIKIPRFDETVALPEFVTEEEVEEAVEKMVEATILF